MTERKSMRQRGREGEEGIREHNWQLSIEQ